MAEQLILDLARRPALKRDDFLIAPCNQEAINLIDRWPSWDNPVAIIHGPPASGKTHILNVWCTKAAAEKLSADALSGDLLMKLDPSCCVAIDDVEQIFSDGKQEKQNALFHLINKVREEGGFLLATTQTPPSAWEINLRDLDSRLKAAHIVEISPPDETLLLGLFVKLMHDRQLAVDPDMVHYIISRSDRSFENIIRAAEKIDAASLKEKRRITLPFVKKILSL